MHASVQSATDEQHQTVVKKPRKQSVVQKHSPEQQKEKLRRPSQDPTLKRYSSLYFKKQLDDVICKLTNSLPQHESSLFVEQAEAFDIQPHVYKNFLHYVLHDGSAAEQVTHQITSALALLNKVILEQQTVLISKATTTTITTTAQVPAATTITSSFSLKSLTNWLSSSNANQQQQQVQEVKTEEFLPCSQALTKAVVATFENIVLVAQQHLQQEKQIPQDSILLDQDVVRWCVEKWLFEHVYESLFATDASDKVKDRLLSAKIAALAALVQPEHMNVSITMYHNEHWQHAMFALKKMNMYQTPRAKLQCIEASFKSLIKLAYSLKKQINMDDDPTADDLLPLCILLILKANPKNLHSNIKHVTFV